MRPTQQLLWSDGSVDESQPVGPCEPECSALLMRIALTCYACGSTHVSTGRLLDGGPDTVGKGLDMYESLVRACDKLREGGTDTDTAHGGDSPVYITETWDYRSDEEMTEWASETGFQPKERPKALSESKAP